MNNNNPSPHWEDAPIWAKWAKLEDGTWTAFSHNPKISNGRNSYGFRYEIFGYNENIDVVLLQKRLKNE